jgi:hypothetical protein
MSIYLSIYIPPINLSIYPSILVAKRTSSSSSLLRTALHHLTPKTNLDTAPSVSHLAFVASLPRCLVALLHCIALRCVLCLHTCRAAPRHVFVTPCRDGVIPIRIAHSATYNSSLLHRITSHRIASHRIASHRALGPRAEPHMHRHMDRGR